ncbi:MAG: hypothetical protein WC920_06420, partial [Aliarcobacter sp.]
YLFLLIKWCIFTLHYWYILPLHLTAYLVPASLYEKMMEVMDDYYLSKEVEERLKDNEKPIRVELDELLS